MHPLLKAGDSMISFTLGAKTKKGHCFNFTPSHGSPHLFFPPPRYLWGSLSPMKNVPLRKQIFKLLKIKKKKAVSWLWVDDVHRSAKPCGLQPVWFLLPADHYAGLRLLTLPAYPTCGSVVVYEAQRSFHTTQITNLTVPLSTALLNWFLPITWLQWCQFFFLTFWAMPFLSSTCLPQAVQENSRVDFARKPL